MVALQESGRLASSAVMILSALCLNALVAGPAGAHGVVVFAWVEGGRVHVESKFSGGRKVRGGSVVVMDEQGNELLSGTTDDEGEFDFAVPAATDLKIVLSAGAGHRGEWSISAAEIEAAGGGKEPPGAGGDRGAAAEKAGRPPAGPRAEEVRAAAPDADLAAIESVVEEALDRKLGPVLKMVADSRRAGPDVRDILGGLGYIMGLVGIAAYGPSRKKA